MTVVVLGADRVTIDESHDRVACVCEDPGHVAGLSRRPPYERGDGLNFHVHPSFCCDPPEANHRD